MSKSKIVLIQANPPAGFNFHGEAHRLWPASPPVKVEVLDQEDDPPEVPVTRKRGDEEVVETAPDPHRIGRRSFRALQANPRIRILSDQDSITGAEVAAAQGEAAKLRAEVVYLKGQIQNYEVENDQLKARVYELEKVAGISPTPFPKPVDEQGVVAVGQGDPVDAALAEFGDEDETAAGDEAEANDQKAAPRAKGKPQAKNQKAASK